MRTFKHTVAAGSWDHLHRGHREFLSKAFELAEKVAIGVTDEAMTKTKIWAENLESFEVRRENVLKWLEENRMQSRATIHQLHDIYGAAITDATIDSLLVTEKTSAGGKAVNVKRKELGLPPLALELTGLTPATDGREISSERIRAGEINREGIVYLQRFEQAESLKLPADLRPLFKIPFGKLFPGMDSEVIEPLKDWLQDQVMTKTITIGDVTTKLLAKYGVPLDLAIVDLVVERQPRYKEIVELGVKGAEVIKVVNLAGTITRELAQAIQESMTAQNLRVILVEGEEDLAVLPAVLAAPLKSVVLYGQPHEGLVAVIVNEEKKAEAYELLTKFE